MKYISITPTSSSELVQLVDEFSMEGHHYNVNFTAAGLFTIDLRMLNAVSSIHNRKILMDFTKIQFIPIPTTVDRGSDNLLLDLDSI